MVFLRWSAFLGPGSILQDFDWKMDNYYNHTERARGVVYPEDLSPITIYRNDNSKERLLEIGIQRPYNMMPSSYITMNNKKYHMTTGKELSLKLPVNSSYNVSAPQTIDVAAGIIRATFLKWSDGNTSNMRNVNLDQDVDLFCSIQSTISSACNFQYER